MCKNSTGLFNVLTGEFKSQHNDMILLLQCCKLHRKGNESAQKWMDRLNIKAAECNYKEHYRRLKEQFINDTDNEDIMQEII